MVRWGQTSYDSAQSAAAALTYRTDIFDAALRSMTSPPVIEDGLGAFAGPLFDPENIASHLEAWPIGTRLG
jgi:NitT/TauT family transport system ATP-binding protein